MSKRLVIIFSLAVVVPAALLLAPAACSGTTPPLSEIPAGTARLGSREPGGGARRQTALPAFLLGRREITCGEFARFRDREPWKSAPPDLPAAQVSLEDARAYCDWLSRKTASRVRLPTEDEWEYAARGGIRGAPYPWGWDLPGGRAHFNAARPRPVAGFRANPFGLHDCAGNLAEWCAPESPTSTAAVARGGSFADRDAGRLTVFRRVEFPVTYRDADVGFRILVERE